MKNAIYNPQKENYMNYQYIMVKNNKIRNNFHPSTQNLPKESLTEK
jgi:hypothetical protein